jgi:endo-alpha-N-acetylgalactosaminidase
MNKQFIYLLITSILPLITFSQSTQDTSISSSELVLTVDSEFPLIKQYKLLKNDAILNGNVSSNKIILINGIEFSPEVTSSVKENTIIYTMSLEDIKVLLKVQIEVIDNIVNLKFIEIKESGEFKVNTIAFPEHY